MVFYEKISGKKWEEFDIETVQLGLFPSRPFSQLGPWSTRPLSQLGQVYSACCSLTKGDVVQNACVCY